MANKHMTTNLNALQVNKLTPETQYATDSNIDQFLEDLHALCAKHNLSIGHEDTQGAFVIHPWNAHNWDWMAACMVDVTALHPSVQQQIKDAVSGN